MDDAEWSFKGVILTDGNKYLNLLLEWGVRTEEAECNLRGEIVTLNLVVIFIVS